MERTEEDHSNINWQKLLTLDDMTHPRPIATYFELRYFEPNQGLRPIHYHEKKTENGLETKKNCKFSDKYCDSSES